MYTNNFIILASPFFSMLFTNPSDLLIPSSLNNSYIEVVLLNLGAALGIFWVNTSSIRYNFGKLYPLIDMQFILLELLELGVLYPKDQPGREELLYGLFIIKKLGTGVAIGVNYYLGMMLLKKKCTIFKDFMGMVLLLYMWYAFGLIAGIALKEIPESTVPYLPITTFFSLVRLIYVKCKLREDHLNPNREEREAELFRKENLRSAYMQLSESFFETDLNRNQVVEKLFHSGHIKFFVSFYLITLASEITPMLEFQRLALMHSPRHMEYSFALFHLLGALFLYSIRNFIANKLKYYLASGLVVSLLCLLIFICQRFLEEHVLVLLMVIMLYMAAYGASLGPFFYIFVGYRYNNLGFSICYINKWIIYALQAVVSLYIDETSLKSDINRYRQIIATSILLVGIVVALYFLMKENELVEMKIEDNLQPKRSEVAKIEESVELRDSSIAQFAEQH